MIVLFTHKSCARFVFISDRLLAQKDYVDDVHTISIPPNATSMDKYCIDMRDIIIDDHVLESNETFDITLQSVSPCGRVGSESNTVVEIIDNDSKAILLALSTLYTLC